MKSSTVARRCLVPVLAALGVLAYLLLSWVSLELALTYPSMSHLRLPLSVAAVLPAVPGAVALRLVRSCFAGTARYLLVAVVGATLAMAPEQSPSVFLAWCVAEVLTLFLWLSAALSTGLFEQATTMRAEHELSV